MKKFLILVATVAVFAFQNAHSMLLKNKIFNIDAVKTGNHGKRKYSKRESSYKKIKNLIIPQEKTTTSEKPEIQIDQERKLQDIQSNLMIARFARNIAALGVLSPFAAITSLYALLASAGDIDPASCFFSATILGGAFTGPVARFSWPAFKYYAWINTELLKRDQNTAKTVLDIIKYNEKKDRKKQAD